LPFGGPPPLFCGFLLSFFTADLGNACLFGCPRCIPASLLFSLSLSACVAFALLCCGGFGPYPGPLSAFIGYAFLGFSLLARAFL